MTSWLQKHCLKVENDCMKLRKYEKLQERNKIRESVQKSKQVCKKLRKLLIAINF